MTDTFGLAVIRVAKTLAVYAVVAGLLWLFLPSIQRTFLLPQLFSTLFGTLLLAGIPVAAAVAWRYPRLGMDGDDAELP